MPVDKVELLLKSLEKRVTDIEKQMQKAPAGDPGAMAKRVNELEKAVAQLKLSVAGKKDQKTEEQQVEKKVMKMLNDVHLDQRLKAMEAQFGKSLEGKQAEKETRKIIADLKLDAKDRELDARMKVLEAEIKTAMAAANAAHR